MFENSLFVKPEAKSIRLYVIITCKIITSLRIHFSLFGTLMLKRLLWKEVLHIMKSIADDIWNSFLFHLHPQKPNSTIGERSQTIPGGSDSFQQPLTVYSFFYIMCRKSSADEMNENSEWMNEWGARKAAGVLKYLFEEKGSAKKMYKQDSA